MSTLVFSYFAVVLIFFGQLCSLGPGQVVLGRPHVLVSVIPARASPITYFWALLQKEKERPFIQWGYHVIEMVVMELFASSGCQFSNGLSFS